MTELLELARALVSPGKGIRPALLPPSLNIRAISLGGNTLMKRKPLNLRHLIKRFHLRELSLIEDAILARLKLIGNEEVRGPRGLLREDLRHPREEVVPFRGGDGLFPLPWREKVLVFPDLVEGREFGGAALLLGERCVCFCALLVLFVAAVVVAAVVVVHAGEEAGLVFCGCFGEVEFFEVGFGFWELWFGWCLLLLLRFFVWLFVWLFAWLFVGIFVRHTF
jgi:hypothetical protein